MNPQDPLTALQPLRTPEAISWWPPATGWWMLAFLVLLAVLAGAWFGFRRWRAWAHRRAALSQLASLPVEHEEFPAQVNRLLKAAALRSYGKRRVASLHGGDWLAFLASSGSAQFPAYFGDAPYRPPAAQEHEALRQAAESWLRSHRVPL